MRCVYIYIWEAHNVSPTYSTHLLWTVVAKGRTLDIEGATAKAIHRGEVTLLTLDHVPCVDRLGLSVSRGGVSHDALNVIVCGIRDVGAQN